jgi:nucleoid DNA-binding protein
MSSYANITMCNALSKRLDMNNKDIQKVLNGFVEFVKDEVAKGKNVTLTNFVKFSRGYRASRQMRSIRKGPEEEGRMLTIPAAYCLKTSVLTGTKKFFKELPIVDDETIETNDDASQEEDESHESHESHDSSDEAEVEEKKPKKASKKQAKETDKETDKESDKETKPKEKKTKKGKKTEEPIVVDDTDEEKPEEKPKEKKPKKEKTGKKAKKEEEEKLVEMHTSDDDF